MTSVNRLPDSDSVNLGSNPSPPATTFPDEIGVSRIFPAADKADKEEQTAHEHRTNVGTVAGPLSLASLITAYKTDPASRYRRKIRFKTRENYDGLMRRLERDHGVVNVRDIKIVSLLSWHEAWSKPNPGGKPKVAMAHSLMVMLRTLMNYGSSYLENPECKRVADILRNERFEQGGSRKERLTADQATAIRRQARLTAQRSIALAQAFQFECTLRQKDVIGEWVPRAEKGDSDTFRADGFKWLRGLRWEEIDDALVLRHVTSKRQKALEVDLTLAHMVLEELIRVYPDLIAIDPETREAVINRHLLPAAGPIIIRERDGLPYAAHEYRRQWRRIATAVGVPKHVWNMDSRSGAITEATDAGASLEDVRHAATHSTVQMTAKYSRGSENKIVEVMKKRIAHRRGVSTNSMR